MMYQDAIAYVQGQATDEELRNFIEAIKMRRAWLGRQNIRAIVTGDKVSFTGRNGLTITGTVTKVMQKNVIVNTSRGNFRVPANMLQAG
jgi:hypothetical protein